MKRPIKKTELELSVVSPELEGLLDPKGVYGYFGRERFGFEIDSKLMQRVFFKDSFALLLVTIGSQIVEKGRELYTKNKYKDYFNLHQFAAAAADATAEYIHRLICVELGQDRGKTRRISPGYPVWPNLSDQKKIFELLKPEKIGVSLTQTYQLVPEYSVSAMIVF